jgi:hypothetical protein
MNAARSHVGLTEMLGGEQAGHALAGIMGPYDTDSAVKVVEASTNLFLCSSCLCDAELTVPAAFELQGERANAEDDS